MAEQSAMVDPRAEAKGRAIWLDMNQQALDNAYDQEKYAPNRAQIVERRIANSERTRAILGAPFRFAYGSSEIEGLDVFRCAAR
jgi:arylformamidase